MSKSIEIGRLYFNANTGTYYKPTEYHGGGVFACNILVNELDPDTDEPTGELIPDAPNWSYMTATELLKME